MLELFSHDRVKLHKNIEHVYGDLTDFNFCLEQTKDIQNIFHLAGIKCSIDVAI